MPETVTWYPGKNADEEIANLYKLVGEITAFWAGVEDGVFELFVLGLQGEWSGDVRPYREVFFAFGSFDQKLKMVDAAFTIQLDGRPHLAAEWKALKGALKKAAQLRNTAAHLTPMAASSLDPEAQANVRLIPPFWKGKPGTSDFNSQGYSYDQLKAEYQSVSTFGPNFYQLGYMVQEFGRTLHKQLT